MLVNTFTFCPATHISPSFVGFLETLVLRQHFKSALWQYFRPFFFFSELQIKVCCPAPLQSLFSIVVLPKVERACKSQGEAGEKQILSQSVWPGLRGVPRWCRYGWSQNHTVSTRLYSSLFTFLGGCTWFPGLP